MRSAGQALAVDLHPGLAAPTVARALVARPVVHTNAEAASQGARDPASTRHPVDENPRVEAPHVDDGRVAYDRVRTSIAQRRGAKLDDFRRASDKLDASVIRRRCDAVDPLHEIFHLFVVPFNRRKNLRVQTEE